MGSYTTNIKVSQVRIFASTSVPFRSTAVQIQIYHILFYCSILFYSIIFSYILLYSILFYSILFCSILFYSILFCSVLFHYFLFYSILFYSIIFYSILFYESTNMTSPTLLSDYLCLCRNLSLAGELLCSERALPPYPLPPPAHKRSNGHLVGVGSRSRAYLTH
jgi:hypothetical protein